MQLKIEKMIYGGDGLAHSPAGDSGRGKAVFVPFTLEGETVEARLGEQKASFARARVEQVMEPSPLRIEPCCPYYARCGGCHYQHTNYDHQLEIKQSVLRENLARFAKLEWPGDLTVHRSEPWNYRNRTRLQVRTAPDFVVAYFRFASHQLLPVEQCPISSKLINRAIEKLWQLGRGGASPEAVREIEFFTNAEDDRLIAELYLDGNAPEAQMASFCERFSEELPELAGVSVFRVEAREREFREPQNIGEAGEPYIAYKASDFEYRVSAGSFFQTNRFMTSKLIELVTDGRSGKGALDLYAGVGLFAAPLAKNFERVMAVEASRYSFGDLTKNSPPNLKAVRDLTDKFLTSQTKSLRENLPDLIVVDPPRAGLGDKVTRALCNIGAPRITYLSCDPATLSRDLNVLIAGGYRPEELHMIDLFPQTFHIESLVQLVRS